MYTVRYYDADLDTWNTHPNQSLADAKAWIKTLHDDITVTHVRVFKDNRCIVSQDKHLLED